MRVLLSSANNFTLVFVIAFKVADGDRYHRENGNKSRWCIRFTLLYVETAFAHYTENARDRCRVSRCLINRHAIIITRPFGFTYALTRVLVIFLYATAARLFSGFVRVRRVRKLEEKILSN